jgi:histidinol phosphatase-like enzyme
MCFLDSFLHKIPGFFILDKFSDDLLQMRFIPALSTEFRPYKPDPAPLLHICDTWNIAPNEVMMIGNSLKDDVSIHSFSQFLYQSVCKYDHSA